MSLRACELRALRRIEAELCSSDPRLRAMFSMFARLTPEALLSGSEVPDAEKERGRPAPVWLEWARRLATPEALRLTLFVAITLAAVMCALFLGGGSASVQCRPASGSRPASSAGVFQRVPVGHGFAGPPSPASGTPRTGAGSARSCPPGGAQPGAPPATQP